MRTGLIDVPFNSAGSNQGEASAPAALRTAGLIDAFKQRGDTTSLDAVSIAAAITMERDAKTGLIAPEVFVAMVASVRTATSAAYARGLMPVLIGGDSAIMLGGLFAARDMLKMNPGLLFVDGHEDAYPPFGSISGESGDMEMGFALGLTRADGLGDLASQLPVVSPHDVAMLGCRDAAELKSEGIESARHKVIVMDDTELRDAGVAITMERWLHHFERHPGRFWFHLDLDVLSSDANPAVSYPQPGGLAWDEVKAVVDAALAAQHLIGIDIAGYNPDKDPDGRVARKVVEIFGAA